MVDQDTDYRAYTTPEALETARAHRTLAMIDTRLPRPAVEPGLVTSWDYGTRLATVVLDSAQDSVHPVACYSMIEDVTPNERVYVQHNPPHTALIVGRAAPAIQTPFNTFGINGPDGFYIGDGGSNWASHCKRGPMCDFRFNISFGPNARVGTVGGRWKIPLPVPVSKLIGLDDNKWVEVGSGMYWCDPTGQRRAFGAHFTAHAGDTEAIIWETSRSVTLAIPIGYPGGSGSDEAAFFGNAPGFLESASSAWFTAAFSYPTD